jgi:hypothetical protein
MPYTTYQRIPNVRIGTVYSCVKYKPFRFTQDLLHLVRFTKRPGAHGHAPATSEPTAEICMVSPEFRKAMDGSFVAPRPRAVSL